MLVVVASGSRSALLGVLLVLLVCFVGSRPGGISRFRVEYLTLTLFAIPAAYLSLGLLPFFEKLDELVLRLTGNPIYSGREQGWQDAVQNFGDIVAFGTGSSQSSVFADGSTLHAHNLVLVRLYSSGLLAALLLSAFFVVLARHARRSNRSALAAGVLGITLHQLFEANFAAGGIPVGIALAFVVGVIASMASVPVPKPGNLDLRGDREQRIVKAKTF